ncbi:MAG: hypothetical protein DRN15_08580 [Thermoprotei archaeon]|nr:MAG: hypothetical protein DRN15_08580 [Thermoprotei archaeon]
MTRTIALSEKAYNELKRLRERLGLSYSELIILLVEEYEKKRRRELVELCRRLKIGEDEVERMRRIIMEARRRRW